MSKIETIKIRNFKGIDRISSDVHSSNVYIVGGNGKGKTSFIDAIWNTLTGKDIPSEPIRIGENESEIEIELTDHLAILEFKKDKKGNTKQTFKLISKTDGEQIDKPRSVLNDLIGVIDFNPNHFFELSAQKQIDYFCSLTGLNFEQIDRDIAELYEQRTFVNKDIKRLKDDSNVWFDPEIADQPIVDVKQLFELKIVEEKKRENMAKVLSELEQRRNRVSELQNEIEKLSAEIKTAEIWIDVPANCPIGDDEMNAIVAQIETADQVNAKINENKSAKVNAEKLKELQSFADEIAEKMEKLKESKRTQLSESIDIDGLEFDGERFLFDGLPFENTQINTANQLIAGLRIGMKLLKGVRILRFDGSLIDDNNMKQIDVWSKGNDIQLFIEQVDRSGGKLEIRVEESTDDK